MDIMEADMRRNPDPRFQGYKDPYGYVARPPLGKEFNFHFKKVLQAGCYDLDKEGIFSEERLPDPKPLDVASDEIFDFGSATAEDIRGEIDAFYEDRSKIEKDGLINQRGMLIVGPPGSGKSTLLRTEANNLIKQDRIVFLSQSPYMMKRALEVFRKLEPLREAVVIMEDIDEAVRYGGQHELLEMMSGLNVPNNVMFIGTANNPEKMSKKLLRPGRFDRKVILPNPGREIREEYLRRKAGQRLTEQQILEIGALSEGMSYGHLREIFIETCHRGMSIKQAIENVSVDFGPEHGGSQFMYQDDCVSAKGW